ncbi:AMP-binding protein [Candidatus Acetothermia bacterium]|nr:AMP-binding protein [Candidatus Acetothermia bacterium]
MQPNIPNNYLPPKEDLPHLIYTLPEMDYPIANTSWNLLDKHIEAGRGEQTAIYFEEERITYRELRERVNRLASSLQRLGVEQGERVMLRLPNRPELIVGLLAVQRLNAVALPTMKLLRARELTYIANDAEAKILIVHNTLFEEIEKCRSELKTVQHFIVVPIAEKTDHLSFDDLLKEGDKSLEPAHSQPDDIALMLYTSGTTGVPKGAWHTHRRILASGDSYARYCLEPKPGDVFGGNPPLPFAYGYGGLFSYPLQHGLSVCLVDSSNPTDYFKAIERSKITVFFSVPTFYNQVLKKLPTAHKDFNTSSLRLCVSAGEPLPAETYQEWLKRFNVKTLDGIGTTEMFHIFISHRASDEIEPGSTGRAVPGYEVKIFDDHLNEVPRGQPGLIGIRGPTGITYWRKPQEQQRVVRQGWSLSGDVYIKDAEGRLWYQARRDDLIISGGYNIAGPEVEGILLEHEAVLECAVVASPDSERGHVVKAFIKLREGYPPSDQLRKALQDFVKENLAPYKYPRKIEFLGESTDLQELPRTETGKIKRNILREREKRSHTPA